MVARPWPLETIVMTIILEQQKQLERLESLLDALQSQDQVREAYPVSGIELLRPSNGAARGGAGDAAGAHTHAALGRDPPQAAGHPDADGGCGMTEFQ
jgi:hypothetical protein